MTAPTKINGKEILRKFGVFSWTNSNKYIVCMLEDNSFSCSCPAWIFKRQECKHIKELRQAISNGRISEIGVEYIQFHSIKCSVRAEK